MSLFGTLFAITIGEWCCCSCVFVPIVIVAARRIPQETELPDGPRFLTWIAYLTCAWICLPMLVIDGSEACSACVGVPIAFVAALAIPRESAPLRQLRFFIWAMFFTFAWIWLHYDWKGHYWSFGRGLKGETVNAEGWCVKEPITPENILIDVAFLVVPLGFLWLLWRYCRPRKSES